MRDVVLDIRLIEINGQPVYELYDVFTGARVEISRNKKAMENALLAHTSKALDDDLERAKAAAQITANLVGKPIDDAMIAKAIKDEIEARKSAELKGGAPKMN